jgi:hypothetical protein
MATYVNDLRLKEITTGDESGTWGTSTNTNLELIAEAFSYGTEVITTNADTHTTTIADGATDPGRSLYLKYTGTLDSACTITIGPNTVSKVWIIENGTSGSQDIIISQGSGANITIPAGDTKVVYSDGAGAGAAFFDAFASLSVVDLKVQDDLTVTGDIDVDGTTNLDVVDIDGALTQDGGAVFNEASADVDFRVESDNDANALFVQGSDGNVGIGTSSPLGDLSIGRNGNASNGNIQLGVDTNNANKYTAITSKTYASDAQPEGFITLASQAYDGGNETFIGGGLGELDASTAVRFYTAATTNTATGTERMRITSAGRVGIGTTSPTRPLDVNGSGIVRGFMTLYGTGTNNALFLHNTAYEWAAYTNASNNFLITDWNAAQTRLTIDTSGRVGIGRTPSIANSKLEVGGADNVPLINVEASGATGGMGIGSTGLQIFHGSSVKMKILSNGRVQYAGIDTAASGALNILGEVGNSYDAIQFYHNSATVVGRIRTAVSSTAYTTSSDYRLKENVDYTWDATTRLKQLKPARFNFIIDDTNTLVDGFLAHEVQEIVPEAITGSKDEVDSEGNPDYQGIDQSKLVPLLVKTIQELEARITALES